MTNNYLTNIKLRPHVVQINKKYDRIFPINYYALIINNPFYLSERHLLLFKRVVKLQFKKRVKIKFKLIPKIPLTARNTGVRMGKGKSKLTGTLTAAVATATVFLLVKIIDGEGVELTQIEIEQFLRRFKTKFPRGAFIVLKFSNKLQNLPNKIL